MSRAQTVLNVAIKKLNPDAVIPKYQTAGAAGFDIHALLNRPVLVSPGETVRIPTGIAVSVGDPSWALYLMSRSGLASKGIVLGNGTGLIDSDYQGELGVLIRNTGSVPYTIADKDRIAQGVFGPVIQANFIEVDEFETATERGTAGFGSTGVRDPVAVIIEADKGGPADVSDLIPDTEGLVVAE